MTRKLLLTVLASTMLSGAPVIPEAAEARSLFEQLFPRAAERRRQRYERRRLRYERQRLQEERRWRRQQRRLRARTKKPRIKKPVFKAYSATALAPVKFALLKTAFDKREHEILAASALENAADIAAETRPIDASAVYGPPPPPSAPTSYGPHPEVLEEASVELPLLVPTELTGALASSGEMRLSAGADYLGRIDLQARHALGKAVVEHYSKSPDFMWTNSDGELNDKGRAIFAVLEDADAYGLMASDYSIPNGLGGPLQSWMRREFALTVAALRYVADARNGVANPNRISGYHDFKAISVDYGRVLEQLAASETPQELMLAAHPQGKTFEALRHELASLRETTAETPEAIMIAPRTFVKPGTINDQIPNIVEAIRRKGTAELLKKHALVLLESHAEGLYTPELVALVKDFQKENRLGTDGIIGKRTIAKLVGDQPENKVEKVLLAMERLRWHPDRLASTRVFINQAAYRATYYRNGAPRVSMKTVVGKPSNQTNFFYDEIEYVEYNPYWGVPKSILVNEMLPKLRNDPGYLDRLGYEVSNGRRRISSYNVDWWGVGSNFPFDVRQPPGRKNALGELKIMFPNKHSIYMHDTPAKKLFGRNKRAFSHGCVRLENPRLMAAAVLG
ncbi:MAG: L,D-transpeptidase family protein, partial [Rhizobiaceae bacterium]